MYTARLSVPTSDADLLRLTEENPGWQVEREANGTIVMTPTGTRSGLRNSRLHDLVSAWNHAHGDGLQFDSSTGFAMWEKAVLSPDVSWVSKARWEALSDSEREGYAPLVPDICIELVSSSDTVRAIKEKLACYFAHGARYVLMVDPIACETWSMGTTPPFFPTDFSELYDIR